MNPKYKIIVEIVVGVLFLLVGSNVITSGLKEFQLDRQWWHLAWAVFGFMVVYSGVDLVRSNWNKL